MISVASPSDFDLIWDLCGFVGRGFRLGVRLGLFPDANPRRLKGRCTLPFRVRTEATAQLYQAM
jgi:hypothetical protein